MAEPEGTEPRQHFMTRCTQDKLCRYLDAAYELGIEVAGWSYTGPGKKPDQRADCIIVTRGAPIPGPAGRRIFTSREE